MQVMTLSELQDQFDAEWGLLGDPDTGENLEVQGGVVLFHSKDRDEVYRKAREMRPPRSAILYLGRLRGEAMVILARR